MDIKIQLILTFFSTLVASSGFWLYLQKRFDSHSAQEQMILGLGHDRIVSLGLKYIQAGCITQDEYDNLHTYLYTPYKKLGGNGSADRIMAAVNQLPVWDGQTMKGVKDEQ